MSPSEFVKMFDADENRMIGLPYGVKNYDDMLSRFHLIPERYRRTDGQTDRFAISLSISRVTMIIDMECRPNKHQLPTGCREYGSSSWDIVGPFTFLLNNIKALYACFAALFSWFPYNRHSMPYGKNISSVVARFLCNSCTLSFMLDARPVRRARWPGTPHYERKTISIQCYGLGLALGFILWDHHHHHYHH